MEHNGETVEIRIPTQTTLATIHYSVDVQLLAARKDLEHDLITAEYDKYSGYLLGDVEDHDYIIQSRDKVKRLEIALDWLVSFRAACLSISTNLSKNTTEGSDEWK